MKMRFVLGFLALVSLRVFAQAPAHNQALFIPVQSPWYQIHVSAVEDASYYVVNSATRDALYKQAAHQISIDLPYRPGETITADLVSHEVFSRDAMLVTADGQSLKLPAGVHYRGKARDMENSIVTMSVFEDEVLVMILTDEGNFTLAAVPGENPGNHYVLFNDRNVKDIPPLSCHTEVPDNYQIGQPDKSGGESSKHSCKMLDIYIEADYKTYQSRNSNVTNVQNFVTGFFNVVATIYQNEGLNIQISELYVWNIPDNIDQTTSNAGLEGFGHMRQDNFNGDLAHFISTGNFGNGGLAWLDVLCSSYNASWNAYGRFAYSNISNSYSNLPSYSWTVMVFSHEMGHNIGSPHTHSCGWQLSQNVTGPIDTCYQPEGGCYNGPDRPRIGTVMSYCHLSSGINLNQGFGPLPGALLRERVGVGKEYCLGNIPLPTLLLNGNTPVCEGQTLTITNSQALSNYQWEGPSSFSTTSSSVSISNVSQAQEGYYALFYTQGDCMIGDSIFVDVVANPPAFTLVVSPNSLIAPPGYLYQWYNQNGPISGATSATLTSPPFGGFYYCVMSSITGSCSSISDTVGFFVGTEEYSLEQIRVYPNPATDFVTVDIPQSLPGDVSLRLTDMAGRVVYQRIIPVAQQASQYSVPTEGLSAEIYLLEISAGDIRKNFKVAVQK